jgi:hypothetical protein
MRKTLFAILLGSAAAFVIAQEKPKEEQQIDKDAQARIRAEKAVGGVGEVKPEDKAGATVGAGPHKQFKPSGGARRKHDEDSSEREAGRGATR